jgi:hypothetical protein
VIDPQCQRVPSLLHSNELTQLCAELGAAAVLSAVTTSRVVIIGGGLTAIRALGRLVPAIK